MLPNGCAKSVNNGNTAKINIACMRAAYGFFPVLLIMIVGNLPP